MTNCLTGCRTAAQHTTGCTDDQCRGCQPRPADRGQLCTWCYGRLTDAVDAIPALVAHLREIGQPTAAGQRLGDQTSRGGDPAESTVLPAAWLDADELTGLLGSWSLLVMEEHPAQPMRGPHAAPWHGDIAAWITPHLPWCAEQDWAGEMRREMSEYVTTLRHRWPAADDIEPPRTVDMPCPRCGLMSLTYTPPRYAGGPFRVECTDPDCARVFSEDEWARFSALALMPGRGVVAA